jgi:hypothetical protein
MFHLWLTLWHTELGPWGIGRPGFDAEPSKETYAGHTQLQALVQVSTSCSCSLSVFLLRGIHECSFEWPNGSSLDKFWHGTSVGLTNSLHHMEYLLDLCSARLGVPELFGIWLLFTLAVRFKKANIIQLRMQGQLCFCTNALRKNGSRI